MPSAADLAAPAGLIAVLLVAALGGSPVTSASPQPAPARKAARPASGKDVYATHCATCHGKTGEGTAIGRPLTGDKAYGDAEADVRAVIRDGIPDSPMVAFRETLSETEIAAVTKYVVSLSKR